MTARKFHDDRRRDRTLAAAGIQVVRATWLDLDDPEKLASELGAVLARR